MNAHCRHCREFRTTSRLPALLLVLLCDPRSSILYPQSSNRPMLALQVGHSAPVTSVAFSSDGKTLVSASHDNTAKIWDVQSGEVKRTLRGSLPVTSVALSPDGKTLAAVAIEETIKLWDAQSGELTRTLTGRMESIAFSRDGQRLASGGRDGTLKLWEAQTGNLIRTIKVSSSSVHSVAFSPDGHAVASASGVPSKSGELNLWDTQTGELKRAFTVNTSPVNSVTFSPDGKLLAGGSGTAGRSSGQVCIWDAMTGELKRTLTGHAAEVTSVAFSPDSALLVSADFTEIRLWDVPTGEMKRKLSRIGFSSVTFSPDGNTLAGGDMGGQVILWDVRSGKPKRTLRGHNNMLSSVVFSTSGKTIATASLVGHGVRLWDAQTGELKRTLKTTDVSAASVAFSHDDRTIASSSGNTVRLWEAETGKLQRTLNQEGPVSSVAFSPDDRILATGTGAMFSFPSQPAAHGEVKLWDVSTGDLRRSLSEFNGPVSAVTFSPDGKMVASASSDPSKGGEVRLCDAQTGELKQTLRIREVSPIPFIFGLGIAFSPDSTALAVASFMKVTLWEVRTGVLQRTISGQQSAAMTSVAYSPDGKTLACGAMIVSPSATSPIAYGLSLFDPQTGVHKRNLSGHDHMVTSVVFSRDGKTLMSGSYDTTARLWEAATGRQLVTLLSLPPAEGEKSSNDWLVLTQEGYYDGSPGAARYMRWRVGNALVPVEAYEKVFHRPDLIRKAIRGERLPESDRLMQRFLGGQLVPPEVKFVTPREGTEVFDDTMTVAVSASGRNEVKRIELLVNGRLAKESDTSTQFRLTLPNEETIKLRAIAYDEDELQGAAEITIKRRLGAPKLGDLHVLAVGVSKYRDPKLNLAYAAPDAEAFASLWKSMEGSLYRRVFVQPLLDGNANADKLRSELFKLQRNAQANDTVVLFLAGHGMVRAQSGREDYFFATHETESAKLDDTALPWIDLLTMLKNVDSRARVVVFLDACHSGNTLGGQQAESTRLAEALVKRAGVMVFTSSRGTEFSYEYPELKHGAFTAALLEGIRDGKAANRKGVVDPISLLNYLRDRVPELTNNRQTPTAPLFADFGEPFPLARMMK